jgi:hypothetical protein
MPDVIGNTIGNAVAGVITAKSLTQSIAPRGGSELAAERGASRFVSQGFSPTQAEYLAAPYKGMGHHFIPRRAGLPSVISDSPLNVLKPNGISRGEFYELHYKVDPYVFGTRFPNSVGGAWQGRSLGLQKYGGLGQAWYGSPTALKVTVGGVTAAGAGGSYYYLGEDK